MTAELVTVDRSGHLAAGLALPAGDLVDCHGTGGIRNEHVPQLWRCPARPERCGPTTSMTSPALPAQLEVA
jgi:hypothetical protein